MWTQQIRRRQEALRLLFTAGAEVKADFGKSRCRQLLEISLLGLKGYGAADYYLLGLYKDPGLARRFMTNAQYNEARRRLNRPVQGIIEFNKWIFAKYCESLGIPTPHCFGVFHSEFGFTEQQASLRSFEDLCGLLSSIRRPFVVKPLAGDRGEGVRVFEAIDTAQQVLIGANRSKTSFQQFHESLAGKGGAWLFQEKVEQHPLLSELHASSANTARIITLRSDSGDIVILTAALRIGVGGAEVDNTTGGGIAAEIELASGVCRAALSRSSIRPIASHPDSGRRIEGLALPYWDSVKQTTLRAHRFLPFARSLGWDVAFGLYGPVILEVNGSWYYNRVQMTGQSLWETEFGRCLAGPAGRRGQRLQPLRTSSGLPSR
jgi:hypothetical protein